MASGLKEMWSQIRSDGELGRTLAKMRAGFIMLAGISAVLNILLLGGSIYMMLVYDSVLPSQSVPTLLSLLIMVLGVYLFQAAFEILRSRILSDLAAGLTTELSPRVQSAISHFALRRPNGQGNDGLAPLRDLDTIRQFLSSPGPGAFMDLPWVVFFLVILALLHPWLGLSALAGALVLLILTQITANASKQPTDTVAGLSGQRYNLADNSRRHAEIIYALGMQNRMNTRWNALNRQVIAAQDKLTDNIAFFGGMSRVFRLFLQSFVLTVGALLVIKGQASGGVIFASSILAARALAPIDQVTTHWKSFAAALASWKRLESELERVPQSDEVQVKLPVPSKSLEVEDLFVGAPGSREPIIEGISFKLKAGDVLGIIGLSAAGKSTLLRAVLGIWLPLRGTIRLDGAELSQWSRDDLGPHIGYLSQTVELLPGTVAENIARFSQPFDSDKVLAAAQSTGVHDLIVQLPQGYETQVGSEGEQLSAGQRQRIALARALYGEPFLVALDEPNSNLDAVGETALDTAIQAIRKRGGITLIVAHRRAAVARASHILVMRNGRVEAFGPRDEVLGKFPQSVPSNDVPTKPQGKPQQKMSKP